MASRNKLRHSGGKKPMLFIAALSGASSVDEKLAGGLLEMFHHETNMEETLRAKSQRGKKSQEMILQLTCLFCPYKNNSIAPGH